MIRYLALGDSYTIGEGVEAAERWPERIVARLRDDGIPAADPQIIATTGWTTDELADGIVAAAPRGGFDLVTLLVGVNDQYRGRPVEEFAPRFRALLDRAIAFAGGTPSRVVVVSIPDWGVSPFAHDRARAAVAREIDAYNAAARDVARQCGTGWVDVTGLSREAGNASAQYASDGLHPSGLAYAAWTEQVLPAVRSALRVERGSAGGAGARIHPGVTSAGAGAPEVASEHRLRVRRSARWYLLGQPSPAVREIWLVVHGYAQLAREFIAAFEPIASPERLIVAPEALSRFYVPADDARDHHQARVGATWMTREDRDAEILDNIDYLDGLVARTLALLGGPARVVTLGFSQGGATASRAAILGTERCDRLILWGGGPAEELTGQQFAARFGTTPVVLVHGRHDRVVPFTIVDRTAERLRAGGATVDIRPFDGGHRLDAGVLTGLAAEPS